MTHPAAERPSILVTVGMGHWPFDRLVRAVGELSDDYDLFVQSGTSAVELSCAHEPFISFAELSKRIESSDIVITHAGNTVRLAQRAGKVPIVVAREHARDEMGNDHQVSYLRQEEKHGRVLAVWDVDELADVVAGYSAAAAALTAQRALVPHAEPAQVADLLDRTVAGLVAARPSAPRSTPGWGNGQDRPAASRPQAPASSNTNPFQRHPLRRYKFAWDHLAGLSGAHLDVGAGFGDFAGPLAVTTGRPVHAVDASPGYAAELGLRYPEVAVEVVPARGPIAYRDGTFTSVSMLDVLEHAPDEAELLAEARRVLVDEGVLVVTVPRRHAFTWLDPDNVKYRWPRLHRRVYEARFGKAAYQERFADTSDGYFGDIAVERGVHTNYRTDDVIALLRQSGFTPEVVAGANLFWRWFQIPCLLGGRRTRAFFEPAIRLDGDIFDSPKIAANLFVVARRTP